MSKNILIYYPSNKQSNVIETIAIGFVNKGHKVYLLTQSERGSLHSNMEQSGVVCYQHDVKKKLSLFFYLNHLFYLIAFCRKNQIQAVQSHLQQANIISVLAQYFINAKVVVYRHHLIEPSSMSGFFDRIINACAKNMVVPSLIIKQKMITEEKANPSKVKLIPYVYDFEKYSKPNYEEVYSIRAVHSCKLLLLLCGRFVPLKRNNLAFQILKALREENYDIKLMALDEGPELAAAKDYVKMNHLENVVDFLGYKTNVMDYIAACDVMISLSYTEASNNTIKEAGLLAKNVIVCDYVGDFPEYILHGKNGYLANREKPIEDFISFLKEIYNFPQKEVIGNNLKATVLDKFQKTDSKISEHLNLLID